MIKINFDQAWKIVVVIILAIIAIYSYRIDSSLRSYRTNYYPYQTGCGYNAVTGPMSALPNFCVQPLNTK